MAKVSLNDRDTEAESFVGRLQLHERFTCEKTSLSIIGHCLLLMILREVQPLLK